MVKYHMPLKQLNGLVTLQRDMRYSKLFNLPETYVSDIFCNNSRLPEIKYRCEILLNPKLL